METCAARMSEFGEVIVILEHDVKEARKHLMALEFRLEEKRQEIKYFIKNCSVASTSFCEDLNPRVDYRKTLTHPSGDIFHNMKSMAGNFGSYSTFANCSAIATNHASSPKDVQLFDGGPTSFILALLALWLLYLFADLVADIRQYVRWEKSLVADGHIIVKVQPNLNATARTQKPNASAKMQKPGPRLITLLPEHGACNIILDHLDINSLVMLQLALSPMASGSPLLRAFPTLTTASQVLVHPDMLKYLDLMSLSHLEAACSSSRILRGSLLDAYCRVPTAHAVTLSSDHMIAWLQRRVVRLSSIKVTSGVSKRGLQQLMTLISAMDTVTALILRGTADLVADDDLALLPRNLEHLNLIDCTSISCAGVSFVANRCPNLKELLCSVYGDNSELCVTAAAKLPKLQRLRIRRISTEALRVLTESAVSLTHLWVCGWYFSDAALGVLGQHCPNLEFLIVAMDSSSGITDAGLTALAAGCPKLTTFGINSDNFTTSGLQFLSRSCPNIRRVKYSSHVLHFRDNDAVSAIFPRAHICTLVPWEDEW